MTREHSDDMAGRFTDGEYHVIDGWPGFDWRWIEPERSEAFVTCMDIVNHEVERSIARCHLVLCH